MVKKFRELRKNTSPEAQERAHAKAIAMTADLSLAELRRAHHFSQEQLAAKLAIKQLPEVTGVGGKPL